MKDYEVKPVGFLKSIVNSNNFNIFSMLLLGILTSLFFLLIDFITGKYIYGLLSTPVGDRVKELPAFFSVIMVTLVISSQVAVGLAVYVLSFPLMSIPAFLLMSRRGFGFSKEFSMICTAKIRKDFEQANIALPDDELDKIVSMRFFDSFIYLFITTVPERHIAQSASFAFTQLMYGRSIAFLLPLGVFFGMYRSGFTMGVIVIITVFIYALALLFYYNSVKFYADVMASCTLLLLANKAEIQKNSLQQQEPAGGIGNTYFC